VFGRLKMRRDFGVLDGGMLECCGNLLMVGSCNGGSVVGGDRLFLLMTVIMVWKVAWMALICSCIAS